MNVQITGLLIVYPCLVFAVYEKKSGKVRKKQNNLRQKECVQQFNLP